MLSVSEYHKFYLLITLFFSPITYAVSTQQGINFISTNNPAQPFEMAAKLQWNQKKKQWDKIIVLYNGHKKPISNHPIWHYLQSLPLPKRNGQQNGENLFYKAFKKDALCRGKTPISTGQAWHISFNQHPEASYSVPKLLNDWNCPPWHTGENNIQIVHENTNQSSALKLIFRSNESGCHPKPCINWKSHLGDKFNQLYYSYRIKFPENFDFVKGGKLPGIGSNEANSGGNKPTGHDGWSVRTMWDNQGRLGQYVYHPEQADWFGDFFPWDMDGIEKGKWHHIQTWVYLNTPGQANGQIRSWLNGKPVLIKQGMVFRRTQGLEIERLLFSAFFGGQGKEWAPQQNQHLLLDDFIFSQDNPLDANKQ